MRVWISVRSEGQVETIALDLAMFSGQPFAVFERREEGKPPTVQYVLLEHHYLRQVAPGVYIYNREIPAPRPRAR